MGATDAKMQRPKVYLSAQNFQTLLLAAVGVANGTGKQAYATSRQTPAIKQAQTRTESLTELITV